MNSRERYQAVTHYRKADRLFRHEMGPFPETVKRWRAEGIPADKDLAALAGYDRFERAPVQLSLLPGFKLETVSEDAEYRVYCDSRDGVIKKIRKDAQPPAMPQYLRYPLQTREDWKELKKRLDANSAGRIPANWDALKEKYRNRDFPLGVPAGSMFGWLRDWMGVEHITVTLYDDAAWIQEMMEHLADLFVAVLEKVVFDVQFDFAIMWEDMAYKTGSLISPRHVREFMMPNYKKVTSLLHKAGIDTIMLDSDGNVEELIPLWLECGINYIYPFEVAADMDVVRLRRKFGKDLIMGGGMDKRVMASDKGAIKDMISEKKSLIEEGGYVPGCDHAIPPDVSWGNFMYYRELLNEF